MERHELQRLPRGPGHNDGLASVASASAGAPDDEHISVTVTIDQSHHDDFQPIQEPCEADDEVVQPAKQLRVFAILVALFSTLFISALDQTIVATAIPTICSDLHSASGYTWIGGAYLLANAASGNIWVALSDIWGRKPILLGAVAFFAGGSIICALANSMPVLITGRAFQGTAAGGLIAMVHIVISDLFSMRKRGLYLGLLECIWAVAGASGPTLGGVLTEKASWRWIFWINLPVTGLTWILLLVFLSVHNPHTKFSDGMKAIDWFGSVTILGVVLMVLLGLNFGGVTFAWSSPTVICLIVFGSFSSLFFIYSEKRLARYPLMPLDLFKSRSNIAALVVNACHSFVFIGGEYFIPLFLQSAKSASPLRSGILIIPLTVAEAITGLIVGVLLHKTGRYLEIIWAGEIVGFQIVAGLGAGLLFAPPLIALQSMVSQEKTATATATFEFIRNISGALTIIIGGVVFQNGMKLQAPGLASSGLPGNLTHAFTEGDAAANVLMVSMIRDPAQSLAVREAYAGSIRNMWIMYTCIAGLSAVASAFIGKQVLSQEHVETKTGIKT